MILDAQLMFDDDVALTATRDSTNVIDLLRVSQDIGNGENLWLYFSVGTTLDSTEEDATLQIALVTDDNTGLDSATVLQDLPAVIAEATLAAGFAVMLRIHPTTVMERYLGVIYTVGTHNFTSGKITCALVKDVQNTKAYPGNFTSA